jgi:hypothetical protein
VTTIKAGDEVRVFDTSRYRHCPEDGWQAIVTSVARRYATAEFERMESRFGSYGEQVAVKRAIVFDMDTGGERAGKGASGLNLTVKTPELVALERRRADSEATLREHKIRLDFGHRLTLEQIEALAEAARTFTDTTDTEA